MPVTSVRELRVLQTCKHPNLVELKRVVTGGARRWLENWHQWQRWGPCRCLFLTGLPWVPACHSPRACLLLLPLRLLPLLLHPTCSPRPHNTAGPRLDSVFLVFEYCPHDMGKLVDSLPKPFHESEVKCLLQQVRSCSELAAVALPLPPVAPCLRHSSHPTPSHPSPPVPPCYPATPTLPLPAPCLFPAALPQLLSAVAYLHDRWVMHRDLKLSNLLFTNQARRRPRPAACASRRKGPPLAATGISVPGSLCESGAGA